MSLIFYTVKFFEGNFIFKFVLSQNCNEAAEKCLIYHIVIDWIVGFEMESGCNRTSFSMEIIQRGTMVGHGGL